jgi:hypothetical protein
MVLVPTRRRIFAAAVAAVLAARAAAADPAAQAPAPTSAAAEAASTATAPAAGEPGAAAPVAATPAAEPTWKRAYEATLGLGYYERLHAGAAWRPNPRSALGLFAGSNLSVSDSTTWDVGLSYEHAVGRRVATMELGWDVKALYWQQSNPDYDWKMMTLVGGAYLARELRRGVTLALDGGLARNIGLDSTRKQNVNFEYPTQWTGSLCLSLRYRFDEW